MIFRLTAEDYQDMDDCGGGFCLSCGETAYGMEPDARNYICDARNYTCEECGAAEVFGISELLLMGNVKII